MKHFFLALAVVALPVAGVSALSLPPKFTDAALVTRATSIPRFDSALVASGDFVARKQAERKACRRSQTADIAPLAANFGDDLAGFLESPRYLRSLEQIDAAALSEGRVERQPWSADYWPIARGILGARNFELAFKAQSDWHQRSLYIQRYPASLVLEMRGQEGLAKLSPSEKYELIIGDHAGGLTTSMWQQGREYYDRTGEVESWMGICHGWAPAAIAEQRPSTEVTIPSADGKWSVPLTPSEIKGLVSYSWATNRYGALFLGSRCSKKNPQRDANGRLIDPSCFDLNPATWHLAIINKVGVGKESFVMDATYDYEVWNQPVLGYSYEYFHPETGLVGGRLESTIAASAFVDDPYRAYRSPKVESIVGVRMKVGYVLETGVTAAPRDTEENDVVRWVEYRYDLELDRKGTVVGGEWRTEAHPDFIWLPRTGFRPQSPLDAALADEHWSEGAPIPFRWSKAARLGSSRGFILDKLTGAILKKSAAMPASLR